MGPGWLGAHGIDCKKSSTMPMVSASTGLKAGRHHMLRRRLLKDGKFIIIHLCHASMRWTAEVAVTPPKTKPLSMSSGPDTVPNSM